MTIIPNPPEAPGGSGDNTVSVALNRQITTAFIAARPEVLTLTPRVQSRAASGGFIWTDGTPRNPQTFTMIESGATPLPLVTIDGVERRIEFELLGEWDAVIARRDHFTLQDREWEVVELFYDNGYETRALVAGRG